MKADTQKDQKLELLKEKIKEVKIAMLCTVEGDRPYSRPMATFEMDSEGCLWFFTKDDSPKAEQVNRRQTVNLGYAKPGAQEYVSITGIASIVHDKAKMKELWRPDLKIWFPEGLEDPHICLLKVQPEEAQYWDSGSGTMAMLWKMAKALLTGSDEKIGNNEKMSF
jgi:general stress protein 26